MDPDNRALQMAKSRIEVTTAILLLLVMALPAGAEDFGITALYGQWLGYDTSIMSEDERDSLVCITSAVSIGALITVVGGTAIVIGGTVAASTGTAIALPVLVSSMWWACSLGRAVTPGVLWLQHRGHMLVTKLSGSTTQ
jgi:hypothetical protein